MELFSLPNSLSSVEWTLPPPPLLVYMGPRKFGSRLVRFPGNSCFLCFAYTGTMTVLGQSLHSPPPSQSFLQHLL